jgi:Hexokinase
VVQFKQVVTAVVQRAADLIAAGLAALLYKVGAPEKGGVFGIAVDGSVYHKYPKFRSRLHIALTRALMPSGGMLENPAAVAADMDIGLGGPDSRKFRAKFVDVQNGSCFGAAVVAATAGGNGPHCLGGSLQSLPVPEAGVTGSVDMLWEPESGENVLEGTDQANGGAGSSTLGGLRQRRCEGSTEADASIKTSDGEV